MQGYGKGIYPFGPQYDQQAGKSTIRYQLVDKLYASDKGWCRDKGNVELVNDGSVIVEEYVKGQYIKGRFSSALDDMDNEACSPGGSSVSGTLVLRVD